MTSDIDRKVLVNLTKILEKTGENSGNNHASVQSPDSVLIGYVTSGDTVCLPVKKGQVILLPPFR